MTDERKINGYTLSRIWFDFVFETTEVVTPIHAALYFWIIDLANRLGWKENFSLPTGYTMEAIGLKSYRSYKNALSDLIRWGFIELKARAYNQHTATVVALVLKAKAEQKQRQKQSSHNKTIETEQTIETIKRGEVSPPSEKDFIDVVIGFYVEAFPDTVGAYEKKNRGAVGGLLKKWKEAHPDQNTDETLAGLREHFGRCAGINDAWYRNNMSLGLIASKFTEMTRILNKGQQGGRYSNSEWDNIPRAGTSPDLSKVDNSNLLNED